MPEHHEGGVEIPDEVRVTKAFVQRMVKHVEQEDGFWRNFKIFATGYTVLFSFIVTMIGWVLLEKNGDIKEMQATINKHSNQIERTLAIVENQVEVNKAQQTRIEANTEILMRRR